MPTISAGGVVIGQACAKSPPASAASSRCLGRMTRLSSRRMPGPNGCGKVTTTVAASGVSTGDRLAVHGQGNGQLALGKERLRGLHREGDVGRAERRPVRPAKPGTKSEGEGAAVGARRPPFGQPGLDLLGRAVDPDQAAVGQQRDHFADQVARDQPVERPRLGAHRGDEASTARRSVRRAGARRGPRRTAGGSIPRPGCRRPG